MHPNKGQWDSRVLYKLELIKGEMLVEKDGFSYVLSNVGDEIHHDHHGEGAQSHTEDPVIKHHNVFAKFKNSSWEGQLSESDSSSFYRNYFIGNDQSKWQSKVFAVKKTKLHNFYPNIDLSLETKENAVKYSLIAKPGASVDDIVISYEGADSIYVEDGSLFIATRFGAIEERNLNVWTQGRHGKRDVEASFKIDSNEVRFDFPNGFDENQTLVIDPDLVFSTFTGSTADNWGFTAAPDTSGNVFGGGIVFANGYPTTPGAFDQGFNGGEGTFQIDIGISKFTSDGTGLIYSTYVGGSRNETPNSIVSNDAGELFVYGVTSSQNFPMAGNGFQQTFSGGSLTTQNNLRFSGTDIIVFKLSPDGTAMMASTYLGGSGNDGLNTGNLHYSFGDQFRGEIVVDEDSHVFIASTTRSTNFPTNNGFSTNLGGSQDAVAIKLSPDLSTLMWSTYFGGSGLQTGNAIHLSSTGNVFLTGGTTSGSIPIPGGGHQGDFQGGIGDGYVVELNGNSSQPINGTFIGTGDYDQSYFVQLDLDDNVYVFGQTIGNMGISDDVYNVPNSGQFIRKYSPNLSELEWTTRVGGGNGVVEISPTAFLVSDCYEIYYAGWGGETSSSDEHSQASESTTHNFPTTPEAFQSNTNGSNFYLAVLSQDAKELNYATFMGGVNSSPNHVDGGTSRFDKKGNIYHAVCAACGGQPNGFTSTAGAYSTKNESNNCNMAVFKFNLGIMKAKAEADRKEVCIPNVVNFTNQSENADTFEWDFGDGNTSTEKNPSHYYQEPGTYEIVLYARNSTGCYEEDSIVIEVEVKEFEGGILTSSEFVCPGESIQLEAFGGGEYVWSPAELLSDSTIANPIATIHETTTFSVVITNECGTDTSEIELTSNPMDYGAMIDTNICYLDTIEVTSKGGVSFSWSPEDKIISDPNASSIVVSPDSTTYYHLEMTTAEGCKIFDTVLVAVFYDIPDPILTDTVKVCIGESALINAGGAWRYHWEPDDYLNVNKGDEVITTPEEDIMYHVTFINACGLNYDSVYVDVIKPEAKAFSDTTICIGEYAVLSAEGGVSYEWSPQESIISPNSQATRVFPEVETKYTVLVTDQHGCQDKASVFVDFYPEPFVLTSPDHYGFLGDVVQLTASGNSTKGTYEWSPDQHLSCADCSNPIASPPGTTTYTVDYTDPNGCKASSQVRLVFDAILYVPNTFTPNGDGDNDFFYAKGGNIKAFNMIIFNRWGEVVFETNDFEDRWDGTYNGKPLPDGTYVWKIRYSDDREINFEKKGHVNLLR